MPKGAQSEPSCRDYPYARPSIRAISSSTGRASNSVSAAFDSVSEYRPSLATSGERRQLAQWCFLFRLFRHILSGRSSARSSRNVWQPVLHQRSRCYTMPWDSRIKQAYWSCRYAR